MNDSLKLGLIALVKSAITGEKQVLPPNFDIIDTVEIARKHQILPIIYYGALNCGVDGDSPTMQEMFNAVCKSMLISQRQMAAIKRISDAFDENGIEYMLLKGTLLKSLYPKSEMRSMGDADILIKLEQYEKIKPILSEMGYTEKTVSDHELIWTRPELYLELHKRLIPSYNKDYYAYYGDGWQLGKPLEDNKCRYVMTDEDQMIYLFTHFAKHYRDGGIGIKHLVDLYIYRRANPDLDEKYIETELTKLCLYDFYNNILKTIDVWFCDGKPSAHTELITEIVINSGAYGTSKNRNIAQAVRYLDSDKNYKLAKLKRYFKMTFPSWKVMKLKHSYLEKMPFLLPVAWVIRLFKIVVTKQEQVKVFHDNIQRITAEEFNDYEKTLHFVGLDFNFKE